MTINWKEEDGLVLCIQENCKEETEYPINLHTTNERIVNL